LRTSPPGGGNRVRADPLRARRSGVAADPGIEYTAPLRLPAARPGDF